MNTQSSRKDIHRLCASLTAVKVRNVAQNSVPLWSEAEQRIAIELIKKLAFNTHTKLLTPKINFTVIANSKGEEEVVVAQLNQFVGLRPEQQKLIEQSFREACERKHTRPHANTESS